MALTVEQVQGLAPGCSLIHEVDQVPKGHIRIETGFRYPDGASIDVFILAPTDMFPGYVLSDLGQSVAWLMGANVNPWSTKRRQKLMADAARPYGVEQDASALKLSVNDPGDIPSAIMRLGQACLRVSDILYTRRQILVEEFSDTVEEFFVETDLTYEPNVELVGVGGSPVKVDALVTGPSLQSAVILLSSTTKGYSHTAANEVLRKWVDLDVPQRNEQKVTVFNDQYPVYKDDDLQRLERFSAVVPFSDQNTLQTLLAA